MSTSVAGSQVSADVSRLRQLLGQPELSWLVDRIRGRLERGEPLDGTVTLVGASPQQRRAAAKLLGRSVGRGTSLSIPLPELAATLRRSGAAQSLHEAVQSLAGPVRNLAAERKAEIERWDDSLARSRQSALSTMAWYRDWLDEVSRDGTVTRLIRQGHGKVLSQASAVLERLPAGPEPGSVVLSSLALAVAGDERALSGGPLAGLVLRALAVREGVATPTGPEAEQELWTAAGVVGDDLTSQALVLNLQATGEPLGRWLTEAAATGQPLRITLRQLVAMPVIPWALDLYVCTTAGLIGAAADALGSDCPAMLCTEGQPSVACARLLQSASASGTRVHWHDNFSWSGLRATGTAIRKLRAKPWLMGAAVYHEALTSGSAEPLRGAAEQSPWDPRLAELMRATGRAVPEAAIAPLILTELTEAAAATRA
jgi:uncharacterized protein (TIGR02679 family)